MFKRILLAVDGSEHSKKATEYSIALTQKFGGTIDAVCVIDGETAKKMSFLLRINLKFKGSVRKRLSQSVKCSMLRKLFLVPMFFMVTLALQLLNLRIIGNLIV